MEKDLPRPSHIGAPGQYAEYFKTHKLAAYERDMLLAHARVKVLTMREIASAAGWTSFRTGNSRYGLLGRKIRMAIGLPSAKGDGGQPIQALCLFDGVGKNGDGEWLLRIHDEVVEGLKIAGIVD